MLREAFNHPKIRRLARTLECPLWAARGLMESIWHVTAIHAPQGDIGRFDDEDIADQIGWTEDPSQLVDALVSCRLLDRCECHRLVVHDWSQHCDNGVRQKIQRRGLAFADVECGSASDGGSASDPTPDPELYLSPTPAHPRGSACEPRAGSGSGTGSGPGSGAEGGSGETKSAEPAGFVRWWNAYPGKRTDRRRCLAIWLGREPLESEERRELEPMAGPILDALEAQKRAKHWRGTDGQDYIPHAVNWLHRAKWEDEVAGRAPPKTGLAALSESEQADLYAEAVRRFPDLKAYPRGVDQVRQAMELVHRERQEQAA